MAYWARTPAKNAPCSEYSNNHNYCNKYTTMIVMDQSANYEQYTIYLLQNWTEGRQERFFAESITTDIIDALVDA